jgi:hypothetical protein
LLSNIIIWWQIPLGVLFVVCVLGFPKGLLGTVLDLMRPRNAGFAFEAQSMHGTPLTADPESTP